MADFPSLAPQSRAYTPGSFAALRSTTLSGVETVVRRNNAAVNHQLRLTFVSGLVKDQKSIFSHYAVQNRFQPFDLPSVVLQGSDLTFPSGYEWIYSGPPAVTYSPGVIEVSVQLQLIPPYDPSGSDSGSSTPLALVLTSTDFTDGTALPDDVGSNASSAADRTNPQLSWALTGDDSANVTEYRLSVIDTDASDYIHWNVTAIANTTLAIAATDATDNNNWDGTPTIGATSGGTGAALSNGWEPCTPPPSEPHTYEFVVTGFAADGTLLVTSNTLSGTYTSA